MKIYQVYLDRAYNDPEDNLCFSRRKERFFKNKNDATKYLHNLAETIYLPDTELEALEPDAKYEESYKHYCISKFIKHFKESGGIEMGIVSWIDAWKEDIGDLYILKEIEVK